MKTLIELKSYAFDCLVQIEAWQKNLRETNEAIANYKLETTSEVTGTPEVDMNNNKSSTNE